VDPFAADVWSLGVTLYMLLYGVAPFNGGNHREIGEAVRSTALAFPDPDVDASSSAIFGDDWRALLTGMLCKDPAKRFNLKQIKKHRVLEEADIVTAEEVAMAMSCVKGFMVHEDVKAGGGRKAMLGASYARSVRRVSAMATPLVARLSIAALHRDAGSGRQSLNTSRIPVAASSASGVPGDVRMGLFPAVTGDVQPLLLHHARLSASQDAFGDRSLDGDWTVSSRSSGNRPPVHASNSNSDSQTGRAVPISGACSGQQRPVGTFSVPSVSVRTASGASSRSEGASALSAAGTRPGTPVGTVAPYTPSPPMGEDKKWTARHY
jgi:serine/threonine protein kinase